MSSNYFAINDVALTWEDMREKSSRNSNRIKDYLYDLPANGSLFLDLKKVEYIDSICAQEAVAYIQLNLSRGVLQGKHIIIVQPRPLVLKQIENEVNEVGVVFLHLDSDGILRIRGRAFTKALQNTFRLVMKSRNGVSSQTLIRDIKDEKISLSSWSNYLRCLYDFGVVSRTEMSSSKQGRPTYLYTTLLPELPSKLSNLSTPIYWEVPGLKENQTELIPVDPQLNEAKAS